MPDLGPAELIIVLLVVTFIFGGSKLADIGSSLGRGVKEFRSALKEDDEPGPPAAVEILSAKPTPDLIGLGQPCRKCGSMNQTNARFCAECGEAMAWEDKPEVSALQ
jgi:sec-independent protein translocase protein TatA